METMETSSSSSELKIPKSPVVILMIGMAGSGKSTLMHRMVVRLGSSSSKVYTVNLDPAVKNLAYPVMNIDIRDSVNYKEVMKHFGLGPNGAIMTLGVLGQKRREALAKTSLNLFATKFDQVLNILSKRASELDYILIDTPGQIEVFNWSASGQIICDALAVTYPTVICYVSLMHKVVDTARCVKPVTFMSNMLYACSILYKTKLPFLVSFNKIDVIPHDFLMEWMEDFEKLGEALSRETSYVASLSKSMSLAMEEFYRNLRSVGVSAVTGAGSEAFQKAVQDAAVEFQESYVPFLLEQRRDLEEKRQAAVEEQMRSFERGMDRAKNKRSRDGASINELDRLGEDVHNLTIEERDDDFMDDMD